MSHATHAFFFCAPKGPKQAAFARHHDFSPSRHLTSRLGKLADFNGMMRKKASDSHGHALRALFYFAQSKGAHQALSRFWLADCSNVLYLTGPYTLTTWMKPAHAKFATSSWEVGRVLQQEKEVSISSAEA
jgi:hypothetical protein